MSKITETIKIFLAGFQIRKPDDFRLHIVRLFRLFGIPTLTYFAITELLHGQYDEAIFSILILIAFFLPTRFEAYPKVTNINIRVVMFIMVINFIYLIATRPDTYITSLWIFLVPLPAALLLGAAEGTFWIGVTVVGSTLALRSTAFHDPIPIAYIIRFEFIFMVLGLLSITAQHVRKSIQNLYLEKQNELLHFNENISEKVLIDSLTGAYNRGYLTELFPGLLQLAANGDTPLTILLCDIDQFKEVNDLNGHVQGDRVLKTVAQLLMDNLRSATDNLVRYGGDEFLIVLRNAELEGAANLAERLRIKIENLTFDEMDEGITCSFGVAELKPSDFLEADKDASVQLVGRADHCLYQAKHQGKNQVVAQCNKV